MSEKYVRQIIKRLKCSKSKREEIKKQLVADIASEGDESLDVDG